MIDIVPAIDVIGGKCVRLARGDYNTQRVYSAEPLDVARALEDAGCTRLHLVDLDGARSQHIVNYRTLERIAGHTGLVIDFGGGLKSDMDLHIAFDSGASQVTGGSVAVTHPQVMEGWLKQYGPQAIILGADARNGKVATCGWLDDSDRQVVPFIEHYARLGVTQVISTDIDKDGMLQGPSLELYKSILARLPQLHLIASGGVSGLPDVYALEAIGVPAVIVGKALYENKISLKALEAFNAARAAGQGEND